MGSSLVIRASQLPTMRMTRVLFIPYNCFCFSLLLFPLLSRPARHDVPVEAGGEAPHENSEPDVHRGQDQLLPGLRHTPDNLLRDKLHVVARLCARVQLAISL